MKVFSKRFYNWQAAHNPRLSILAIESKGHDVGDMLANIEIIAQNEEGYPLEIPLPFLATSDFDRVQKLFAEHMAGA